MQGISKVSDVDISYYSLYVPERDCFALTDLCKSFWVVV